MSKIPDTADAVIRDLPPLSVWGKEKISLNERAKQLKSQAIWFCVLGYTVSYLCRTNLSVAMNDILEHFSITRSQAGLMGTLYFWFYAGGQLAAGWLCTKRDPKLVVIIGAVMASICNLGIGFANSYLTILVLWTLNGLALAMFWPPILQIATNWSEPEEYTRISILLNLPTTIGFLIAWSGLGALNSAVRWEWMFWIPAAVVLVFAVLWTIKIQSSPQRAGVSYRPRIPVLTNGQKKSTVTQKLDKQSLWNCLMTETMVAYGMIVLIQGCTKESINLWAPTMLQDISGGESMLIISAVTSLIPIFSTIGLLSTGYLVRYLKGEQKRVMMILLVFGMLGGWAMVILRNSLVGLVVCIGLVLAVVYGVNTILTTLLPLQFAHTVQSGALSSVFNFLSYVGATLGGLISGLIADYLDWQGVYWLWAILSTVAVLIIVAQHHYMSQSVQESCTIE